jgi:hypothetical protein
MTGLSFDGTCPSFEATRASIEQKEQAIDATSPSIKTNLQSIEAKFSSIETTSTLCG